MPAHTLKARVIPSLLLRKGRLVKGVRFAEHRDAGNPATTARAHNAQGADELILLDIDATRENRGPDVAAISAVAAECFMPLAAGGGIRSVADAKAVFEAGADKIVVNTTALDNPALIGQIAHVYGAQAVVLAVDVASDGNTAKVYDHRAGRPAALDAEAWIRDGIARGAGEIRLCSVDREGTRTGLDLDLLLRVRSNLHVPVVIEGGAGSLDDVAAAMRCGADGVALGTLLVFSDNNIVKVRRFLAKGGHNVRI